MIENFPNAAQHIEATRRARVSAALVLRGVGLNALFALLKIAGGILGHTYALIADGVESLLDVVSSSFIWAGLRVASRPPDTNHPFGHGKAEPLAGLLVALLVFVAAGWVGWHAVQEIMTPHVGPHWATLPLLAAVIAVKLIFSRRLLRENRSLGGTALGIEAWHHYADALSSAAAFIGIAIAVMGGKGYESADDWAALVACLVIGWNGVSLARRALDDVMDVAVPPALEGEIRATASAVPEVRGIDKCRARRSGLSLLVDIHVEVDGDLSVRRGHDIAREVKRALLRSTHGVTDVTVHIEPAGG